MLCCLPGRVCTFLSSSWHSRPFDGLMVSGGEQVKQHARMVQVAKLATAAGAMKAVPLAVSGAFHTSLMQPAREALVEVMLPRTFRCTTQTIHLKYISQ
jgi:acyl transferase domain-containing protein